MGECDVNRHKSEAKLGVRCPFEGNLPAALSQAHECEAGRLESALRKAIEAIDDFD
jgi:hypothetical protein